MQPLVPTDSSVVPVSSSDPFSPSAMLAPMATVALSQHNMDPSSTTTTVRPQECEHCNRSLLPVAT
jgi:hypothetical protein